MLQQLASALATILRSNARAPILVAGALLGFGVLIPRRYGYDFFDIRLVLAYAFVPMLFVAPAVTGLMSASHHPAGRSRQGMYAAVIATAVYGWVIACVILAVALTTVNWQQAAFTDWVLPPTRVLLTYAGFSAAAVLFVAAASAYVTLLFSANTARNVLRVGFLGLLLAFYAGARFLPASWQFVLGSEFTAESYRRIAWVLTLSMVLFASGLLYAIKEPFENKAS